MRNSASARSNGYLVAMRECDIIEEANRGPIRQPPSIGSLHISNRWIIKEIGRFMWCRNSLRMRQDFGHVWETRRSWPRIWWWLPLIIILRWGWCNLNLLHQAKQVFSFSDLRFFHIVLGQGAILASYRATLLLSHEFWFCSRQRRLHRHTRAFCLHLRG